MRITAFVIAAGLEISGCYLMWLGQKQANTFLWLSGVVALIGFGFILAQFSGSLPSRAYAAYGGIYVAMSLLWMLAVDKVMPDRWDLAGTLLTIAGTLTILFGARN